MRAFCAPQSMQLPLDIKRGWSGQLAHLAGGVMLARCGFPTPCMMVGCLFNPIIFFVVCYLSRFFSSSVERGRRKNVTPYKDGPTNARGLLER